VIELQLPMPPSANHLWVRARKGMRKSDRYVAWLMLAAYEARQQPFKRVCGPYKLSIAVSRPNKRRADIDNKIKPVSDLLMHIGAIEDDSNCEMVSARWVTTGDGVQVRIEPAGLE
jgi:crossover junction endodeoxyribonuclease RusA